MPPNNLGCALKAEAASDHGKLGRHQTPNQKNQKDGSSNEYEWDIVWRNVIVMAYFYIGGLYGLYLLCAVCTWKTFLWCFYLTVIGTLGATAGAHRLWTHNTYKAKLPLRILLAYFQTTCFQNDIYDWVRDHRMHHKYTDTDADPHSAARGFFFSHVGWLLVRKHKDLKEKGKTIYLKDLEADPVVMFQRKYFPILMPVLCFILPALVPWYFWGESLHVSWYTASIFRYSFNVNGIWLTNSAAHMFGWRPYDRNISARDLTIHGYIGLGEGWHNYHHVFPWDYKAAEFGGFAENVTAKFIEMFAAIGWAYDLKTVSADMVKKRMARTGEGAKEIGSSEKINYENNVWGWGDVEMSEEDKMDVIRINTLKE